MSAAADARVAGPAVRFDGVAKRYRGRGGDVVALRKLSFELAPGGGLLVAGPPGSGKSTLLLLAGALLRPTLGEVHVAGRELGRLPEHALARFRREHVGFLFQSFRLLRGFSARENVELALVPRGLGRGERTRRALAALAEAGVAERAELRVNDLSGGEQQRVALARALVGAPPFVLADEPTSNVDGPTADHILARLVAARRGGATIVVASHDPERVIGCGLVDRVARFDGAGRVRFEDLPTAPSDPCGTA